MVAQEKALPRPQRRAKNAFDSSPLSHRNALSEADSAALRQEYRRLGIRTYPYPFGGALAVVSDVDSSQRDRYAAYVGILTAELGLDFGDSTWLVPRHTSVGTATKNNGFGFFSWRYDDGRGDPSESVAATRTLNESLVEFHLGNVDHFHSFLPRGPRFVVVDEIEAVAEGVTCEIGPVENRGYWGCRNLFLSTVCVVGAADHAIEVRTVRVEETSGAVMDRFVPTGCHSIGGGRNLYSFDVELSPPATATLPELARLSRVTLHLAAAEQARNVECIALGNSSGPLLLDRLRLLQSRFNVETSLITAHSSYHFRDASVAAKRDEAQQRAVAAAEPKLAQTGQVTDRKGRVLFSTDGDEPCSPMRVFPELSSELGVRFVVPAGFTANSPMGSDPFDLVRPSQTRAASGIYVAKRVMPNVHTPPDGKKFDDLRALRGTFTKRVASLLRHNRETPGLCWPIYTHLGALEAEENRKEGEGTPAALPSPYLEPEPLHLLQDQMFGFTDGARERGRLWFTRGTTLYEYALMLRSVGQHVHRDGPDIVRISSWVDPVLQCRLPHSASQLYGLTFYVDDADLAEVFLDGRSIECVIRNPRDETGRPSVTIAECEIRHVLFEQLDPTLNLPQEVELADARWHWQRAARDDGAYGRLTSNVVASGNKLAGMCLPLFGWHPIGAQLFRCSVRPAPDARFGILLSTKSGGRFFFGDQQLLPSIEGPLTAHYALSRTGTGDRWLSFVVPFHDLVWAAGTGAGGPMPNHALAAVTLLVVGDGGVDFANVAFLRPRATSQPKREEQLYCVGGCVPSFSADQLVHIAPASESDAPVRHETVDQRGYFCFAGLSRGVYRVWSEAEAHRLVDRRGGLVEVGTNVVHLELDRRAES
jgi:hypothetical protein